MSAGECRFQTHSLALSMPAETEVKGSRGIQREEREFICLVTQPGALDCNRESNVAKQNHHGRQPHCIPHSMLQWGSSQLGICWPVRGQNLAPVLLAPIWQDIFTLCFLLLQTFQAKSVIRLMEPAPALILLCLTAETSLTSVGMSYRNSFRRPGTGRMPSINHGLESPSRPV